MMNVFSSIKQKHLIGSELGSAIENWPVTILLIIGAFLEGVPRVSGIHKKINCYTVAPLNF